MDRRRFERQEKSAPEHHRRHPRARRLQESEARESQASEETEGKRLQAEQAAAEHNQGAVLIQLAVRSSQFAVRSSQLAATKRRVILSRRSLRSAAKDLPTQWRPAPCSLEGPSPSTRLRMTRRILCDSETRRLGEGRAGPKPYQFDRLSNRCSAEEPSTASKPCSFSPAPATGHRCALRRLQHAKTFRRSS